MQLHCGNHNALHKSVTGVLPSHRHHHQQHYSHLQHHYQHPQPLHRCSPLAALPVRTLSRGQRVHVQHAGRQLIGQVLQHDPHSDMVSLLLQLNPSSSQCSISSADSEMGSPNSISSIGATIISSKTPTTNRRVSLSQPLFLHVKRPFSELRLVDPHTIAAHTSAARVASFVLNPNTNVQPRPTQPDPFKSFIVLPSTANQTKLSLDSSTINHLDQHHHHHPQLNLTAMLGNNTENGLIKLESDTDILQPFDPAIVVSPLPTDSSSLLDSTSIFNASTSSSFES